MIWWHGVSSEDVHLRVERLPARPIPERKGSSQSVEGRNGDLIDLQDAWANYIQPYEVYLSGEFHGGMQLVAREAVRWLMVKGYQRLEDSYDLGIFRLAYVKSGGSIANTQNSFGRTTIEFNCKPQRFLREGAVERQAPSGTVLLNPTGYIARPRIVVHGAGSGTLTVGGSTMTLADCNGVTIDCENQDVFRGITNLNSTVSGPFPLLGEGETEITWKGGITGLTIKPMWFFI